MATLVLLTVGTALSGPIGGALGSLSASRSTSHCSGPAFARGRGWATFGADVELWNGGPAIYGRCEWRGRSSGRPTSRKRKFRAAARAVRDSRHPYSASFAVALSSRPMGRAEDLGRRQIDPRCSRRSQGPRSALFWAERISRRSADRIHREDRTTPAYRGLALAVFEDLDLAEFGNRIPVLTFELVADEAVRNGLPIVARCERRIDRSRRGSSARRDMRRMATRLGTASLYSIEPRGINVAERDGRRVRVTGFCRHASCARVGS